MYERLKMIANKRFGKQKKANQTKKKEKME